MHNNMLFLAYI